MRTPLLERDPAEVRELLKYATPEERKIVDLGYTELRHDWSVIGREKQQPPDGDWIYWAIVAGRGFGKTRTGAEWLRKRALADRGDYGIISPTIAKTRDVCVESGDRDDWRRRSGFLTVCRPGEVLNYNRSLGEITMHNGSRVKLMAAEELNPAEGWNFRAVWCDEFSSWRRADTWFRDLLPATRIDGRHRFAITTTPRRNELTRWILKRGEEDPERCRVVRGSTLENLENLGADIYDELRRSMSARLARQELEGELLDDVEGALWTMALIDEHTVPDFPDLERLVIAVDPAVTSGEHADDTGIAVCGRSNGTGYMLEDQTVHLDPHAAMAHVVGLYHLLAADCVIVEANNGGDYIPALLHTIDSTVKVEKVNASRGKRTRAEPIQGLTENGRVKFVGAWPELYDQLTTWVPGEPSPDRLDAFVWGMTALFPELANGEPRRLRFR